MALGILEPSGGDPPGTVYVREEEARRTEELDKDATLRRTKDGKIILVPQPTNDPNDPLNWPLWKRDFILTILCLAAVLATVSLPLLAANTLTISIDFAQTPQWGARLTAWALVGASIGAWLCVPVARIYGKRGVFLFSGALMVASSAWGGTTWNASGKKLSTQLVWARILQGVAVAPFESLVNACVGDLYYVHERGPRMAVVNVAVFAGAFMTPIIAGVITDDRRLGWPWTFYFLAIFEALALVLLFFFVPESAYKRPARFNTDLTAQGHVSDETLTSLRSHHETFAAEKLATGRPISPSSVTPPISPVLQVQPGDESVPPRMPYLKQLSPYGGRVSDENILKLLVRPLVLFLHPAVLYASMLQGVIIGWTVMVGVVMSLIFVGPPRLKSEKYVGFLYAGAVVGSVLGLLFSAVYTEVTTRFLVARNKGKYEPEFRLLLVIPTLITTAIGLFGFGQVTLIGTNFSGVVVATFLGFIIFSMVTGAIAAAQYILDAHRDLAVEAFNTMVIWKNLFSFIVTYFAIDWVFQGGIETMFNAFGGIEVAICVLALPMYVFGKRNRALMHRYDLFKLTYCK